MKRFLLGTVVVLGVLLSIGVVMLLIRNANATARINEIRDAGDPTSIAELAPTGINAADNAATHLKPVMDSARKLEVLLGPILNGGGFDWADGLPAEDLASLEAELSKHPEVFAAIDAASQCRHISWDWDFAVDPAQFEMNDAISDTRAIARVSRFRAMYLAAKGKPDEAAAACLAQLKLCRAQDDLPTLLGSLVNNACRWETLTSLNGLLQLTELSEATHEAIEAEVAKHDTPENYVHALKTERAFGLDMMNEHMGLIGKVTGATDGYLDLMNQQIELAELEYHKATKIPPIQVSGLAAMMAPAANTGREAMSRNRASVRCLRLINEIKRRENVMQEKIPATIQANDLGLPPEAIVDVYNGKQCQIKLTDKGWIVYMVGVDQKDDNGLLGDESDIGMGPLELMNF